jgi:hypothetical protein
MLEKVVDPAELVGKKLKIKPFQNHYVTIFDTKSDFGWRYELIFRAGKENIISVNIYSKSCTNFEDPEIKKSFFSGLKLSSSPYPRGYSKNNLIFLEEYQERDNFLASLHL